jgi:hypothetical protein
MTLQSLKPESKSTLVPPELKSMMKGHLPFVPTDLLMRHFVNLIESDQLNGFAVGIVPPDRVKYADKSMKSMI